MPEISLVGVNRARLQMRARLCGLVKSPARRDLPDRLGRKSDLRNLELSAMLRTGIGNMPELRVTEGDGKRGARGDAHDRAAVGIDSRGDIDRDDRRAKRVHPLDRRARNSAHRSIQPGAENSIDDRTRPLPIRRFQIGFARRLHDHAARTGELIVRAQRVALQIAGRSHKRDSNLDSALAKTPRRNHRIAAVVALAAYGQHAGASRLGKMFKKFIGYRLARAGHQRV
ncbi:MAG: hypothetical protein WA740_04115 [Candidatus Binataceae bacterium]